MRRIVALVSLIGLACDDIDLVEPNGEGTPRLSVHVMVEQHEATSYAATVSFLRGSAGATASALIDSTLLIDGSAVASDASGLWGRSWVWQEMLPPGASPRSELSIRGPR